MREDLPKPSTSVDCFQRPTLSVAEIMDPIQTEPLPVYLTTAEAAHLLRLSARTLEKYRTYGSGPSYRKLGGKVVYAASDLIGWAETGAKDSTSDPRTGPPPAKRRHFAST